MAALRCNEILRWTCRANLSTNVRELAHRHGQRRNESSNDLRDRQDTPKVTFDHQKVTQEEWFRPWALCLCATPPKSAQAQLAQQPVLARQLDFYLNFRSFSPSEFVYEVLASRVQRGRCAIEKRAMKMLSCRSTRAEVHCQGPAVAASSETRLRT